LLKKYNIQYSSKGHIAYGEVIQAYKDSDLVVFASTYEGFGMPIIEAQAIGKPVITSNIGAMKEVALDTACLVDPYDVESIKNGIQKLIRDEAYRDLMIKKGLKNVERFSLETISNQYIALYKSIIN
jgi:glycosyltransferase involved in cell wall biosynthesis